MKKFSLILAGALALAVTAGLSACGGRPGDPAMHSITCAENENYRVIDLAEQGQTGSDILFDVESESVFYEIGEVSFNGTPITKGSLGYKFTMPDADVTIEIDLTPVTEYDDPDDYLSWGSGALDCISVAEDKTVSWDVEQEIPLSFDMDKFGSYNSTLDRKEILSSNQEVIPDEALSFDPILDSEINGSSGSNMVRGGSLVVDLKQINPGTATIYLYLDYNNSSSATLMRTFTVTEYGSIKVDTWDVSFAVDNRTGFDDLANVQISFTDSNYIYGGTAPQSQTFTLDELANGEGTFKYAEGHSYTISASHGIYNEETGYYENVTALDIYDWTGEGYGSSDADFNGIRDGVLTLVSLPTKPVEIGLYVD